jgi:hypothetical protein
MLLPNSLGAESWSGKTGAPKAVRVIDVRGCVSRKLLFPNYSSDIYRRTLSSACLHSLLQYYTFPKYSRSSSSNSRRNVAQIPTNSLLPFG